MAAKELIDRKLGTTDPARGATAITGNVSTDLAYVSRGVYVGVPGNLQVRMVDSATTTASVTFVGVQSGTLLPIRVDQIRTSTAQSIVAMW